MKTNLITLLCHCNSEKKLAVLEDNIKLLKQYSFDILIVSHTPVPSSIQDMVEYLIYDKSNPLIHYPERGMVFWHTRTILESKVRLQNILPDYGWTVFNQLINVARLALPLPYTHYSFLNYDIILTEESINELMNPGEFTVSRVEDLSDSRGFRFPGFMLNILSKQNLQKIIPLLSRDQYTLDTNSCIKTGKFRDAEEYWGKLISIFNYKILKNSIKDLISLESPPLFNLNNTSDFKLFFQNNNTHPQIRPNDFNSRIVVYDNTTGGFTLVINDRKILVTGDYIEDLPPVIDYIGYIHKGEIVDFTEFFNSSNFTSITYEN
jgi:hypothetical protein